MKTMHFRKDGTYIREKIGDILISLAGRVLGFRYKMRWSPKSNTKT